MREALLSILALRPCHGYELKHEFERRFGVVSPPLNIGQVYMTLQRLERDGLIVGDQVEQPDRPNKTVYALTAAGRRQLDLWFAAPAVAPRLRDDFITRVLLAQETGFADPFELIDRQRDAYLRNLRQLQDLSLDAAGDGGAGNSPDGPRGALSGLLVEGASLHVEADLKWLDRCEELLRGGGGA